MAIKYLIGFIDRYTNNGAIYPGEPWGEGVGIEAESAAIIRSFSSRDWLTLRSLIENKSNFWVECLITLLDEAYTDSARQMIIYLALNGTEENFLAAMESIRNFRRYVDTYTWLKLENRSTKILSKRIKNTAFCTTNHDSIKK